MKRKNVKLFLNKQTITNVGASKMSRVKGGESEAGITLPPCETNGCPTYTCDDCYTVGDCPSVPNYITCIHCPPF